MARIFISYRRDDSAGHTGRLYDRLVEHFGQDTIFMDTDTILPGQNFVKVIEAEVIASDVLLAIIGKQWLTIADRNGRRRLDNSKDYVRLEIAVALEQDIWVIPVLVQGSTMPQVDQLPDVLVGLSERQAMELRDVSWRSDMGRLITNLEKVLDTIVQGRKQFEMTKPLEAEADIQDDRTPQKSLVDDQKGASSKTGDSSPNMSDDSASSSNSTEIPLKDSKPELYVDWLLDESFPLNPSSQSQMPSGPTSTGIDSPESKSGWSRRSGQGTNLNNESNPSTNSLGQSSGGWSRRLPQTTKPENEANPLADNQRQSSGGWSRRPLQGTDIDDENDPLADNMRLRARRTFQGNKPSDQSGFVDPLERLGSSGGWSRRSLRGTDIDDENDPLADNMRLRPRRSRYNYETNNVPVDSHLFEDLLMDYRLVIGIALVLVILAMIIKNNIPILIAIGMIIGLVAGKSAEDYELQNIFVIDTLCIIGSCLGGIVPIWISGNTGLFEINVTSWVFAFLGALIFLFLGVVVSGKIGSP